MPDSRGIFSNRTLNLNAVRAIGYDMDYTLIHYHMREWELRAYSYIREKLAAQGWPVGGLSFDADLVTRGLIIDIDHGNVVKANRFGYIKRVFHGVKQLDFETQRHFYLRTLVDLGEPRWFFLNTLFTISEACIYMQAVDLLDQGRLGSCMGYRDLFETVRRSADEAHLEGMLKAEIIADPDRFVVLDDETPLALLDQKKAGKKIILISNSEWGYAAPMMSYAFDRFLPDGMTWRELFDIVIIGARKPDFFTLGMPVFDVVNEEGMLREHRGVLESGKAYLGGTAHLVERSLGLNGEQILYVGDHIFVDVNVSKNIRRWRTALIIREIEDEIAATDAVEPLYADLSRMMREKEALEREYAGLKLDVQRTRGRYGPRSGRPVKDLERAISRLYSTILELDARISPLAQTGGSLLNANWGLLMRTGADKSHLARQIESYADIYTSRVSNFLYATPFAFLRSQRGSLPHDPVSERY